ncbi:MAG: hypothetical protein ACE5FW_01485 [Candidatus Aenigmatarchaeota archaeon]
MGNFRRKYLCAERGGGYTGEVRIEAKGYPLNTLHGAIFPFTAGIGEDLSAEFFEETYEGQIAPGEFVNDVYFCDRLFRKMHMNDEPCHPTGKYMRRIQDYIAEMWPEDREELVWRKIDSECRFLFTYRYVGGLRGEEALRLSAPGRIKCRVEGPSPEGKKPHRSPAKNLKNGRVNFRQHRTP